MLFSLSIICITLGSTLAAAPSCATFPFVSSRSDTLVNFSITHDLSDAIPLDICVADPLGKSVLMRRFNIPGETVVLNATAGSIWSVYPTSSDGVCMGTLLFAGIQVSEESSLKFSEWSSMCGMVCSSATPESHTGTRISLKFINDLFKYPVDLCLADNDGIFTLKKTFKRLREGFKVESTTHANWALFISNEKQPCSVERVIKDMSLRQSNSQILLSSWKSNCPS